MKGFQNLSLFWFSHDTFEEFNVQFRCNKLARLQSLILFFFLGGGGGGGGGGVEHDC